VPKDKKRMLYLKIKGNEFRSKSAFENYLKENGLLKEEKQVG
jgi:ribosomal protein L19E